MEFQPLPIGIDNFEKLRREGYYYVDKTNMIRDLLDRKGEVIRQIEERQYVRELFDEGYSKISLQYPALCLVEKETLCSGNCLSGNPLNL